ncbi:hypothetical protein JOC85_003351 [Bacillus mesophilus]|nr:hypothetical protein [Bacillus mesophilus]MBM7662544.1 hypothetical protein [Bacillus mesophilus]
MDYFDDLPKSVKKTLRYIQQDINSLEKLEQIEALILAKINKKKQEFVE